MYIMILDNAFFHYIQKMKISFNIRLTNAEDLNIDEESWIGSLASVGALVGTLVSQVLTRYISARHGLIISALGSVLGWSLIFSAAQERNYMLKHEIEKLKFSSLLEAYGYFEN